MTGPPQEPLPSGSPRTRRVGVTMGAVVCLAAVAGCATSTWMYRRASASLERAERLAYTAGLDAAVEHLEDGELLAAAERLGEAPVALRGWEWRHLLARADESSAALHAYPPHQLEVPMASGTARGRLGFLAANELYWWDGAVVHVWDRGALRRRATFGLEGTVLAVDASGGRAVAIRPSAGPVVADLVSGRPDTALQVAAGRPPIDPSSIVTFSSHGDQVFVGTALGGVRVWDATSGGELPPLLQDAADGADPVISLVADPLSSLVAVAFAARAPVILDRRSGALVRRLDGAAGQAILDHAGGIVVTAGAVVRAWGVEKGDLRMALPADAGPVLSATVSSSGSHVATGGRDGVVRIWDGPGRLARELKGHTDPIVHIRFSQDDAWLLSAQVRPDHVRLWSVRGVSPVQRVIVAEPSALSIVSFGGTKQLCAGGVDGVLRVWKSAPAPNLLAIPIHDSEYTGAGNPQPKPPSLRAIACSQDGAAAATANFYDEVAVWSTTTGERRAVLGRDQGVRALAISADGRLVASARFVRSSEPAGAQSETAGEIGLFEVARPGSVRRIRATGPLFDLAFSPDGRYLYGLLRRRRSESDAAVQRWRLDDPKAEGEAVLDVPDQIFRLALAPDGRFLLAAAARRVHLVETTTVGAGIELTADGADFVDAAFTKDGSRIVSVSADATLRIWDRDGTLIVTTRDARDQPTAVGSIADGEQIVTASNQALHVRSAESWSRPDVRSSVRTLFERHALLADVERAIRIDGRLAPEMRDLALVIARQVGENPYELEARSARTVDRAGASRPAYEKALAEADAAVRISGWEPRFWLTLAAARSRTGDAAGARQALAQAEARHHPPTVRFLAWRAVTSLEVGDAAAAAQSLAQAQALSVTLQDQTDATLAMLAEAERRVGPGR